MSYIRDFTVLQRGWCRIQSVPVVSSGIIPWSLFSATDAICCCIDWCVRCNHTVVTILSAKSIYYKGTSCYRSRNLYRTFTFVENNKMVDIWKYTYIQLPEMFYFVLSVSRWCMFHFRLGCFSTKNNNLPTNSDVILSILKKTVRQTIYTSNGQLWMHYEHILRMLGEYAIWSDRHPREVVPVYQCFRTMGFTFVYVQHWSRENMACVDKQNGKYQIIMKVYVACESLEDRYSVTLVTITTLFPIKRYVMCPLRNSTMEIKNIHLQKEL